MRACEVVCEILESWTSVGTRDIARIREIVLESRFAGPAGLTDGGLVALAGECLQEMLFLHKKLGILVDKKVANNEIWYISEWLKDNRANDKRVTNSTVEDLSDFLGSEIFYYANGAKKNGIGEFLKKGAKAI